jgi:hypothetical protein
MQLRDGEERRHTLLMVAGGHFAGMVIGLRPRGKNEKQDVKGAGDVRILQHKTFHRYTSRSESCQFDSCLMPDSEEEARWLAGSQRQCKVQSRVCRSHAASVR